MTVEVEQSGDLVIIIDSAIQRQEYCSDPVNSQPNTAVYTLIDIFRAKGVVKTETPDSYYIYWNPDDRLVALNMVTVIPARIPEALRYLQLVAESFNLQPVGISRREGFQPVVLDEARISWILTYPEEFYPDVVTFQHSLPGDSRLKPLQSHGHEEPHVLS